MTSVIRFALSILALHALTTIHFWWEDVRWHESLFQVHPDWLVLLATAVVAVLAFGYRAWIAHASAIALIGIHLYRTCETVLPKIRGGVPFDPFNDVLELSALPHLVLHQHSTVVQWVIGIAAIVGGVGLYSLVFALVRCVLRACRQPALGYGILAIIQLTLIGVWLETARTTGTRSRVFTDSVLARGAAEATDLVVSGRWNVGAQFKRLAAEANERLRGTPKDLTGLDDADVFLLFIESYGRAVSRTDAGRRAFASWLPELNTTLDRAGFGSCSAFVTQSIVGGNSTFAHTEVMTGVEVPTRRIFERVLRSQLSALPAMLRKIGYRTIFVQPAMPYEWPEGAQFFGFDVEMFGPAFSYDGHKYPWGDMPDQYALQQLLAREFSNPTEPRFVAYVSVTSHAPFSEIPPYFDDWSQAMRSGAFARDPERSYPITIYNYIGHARAEEACLDSIHYSLRVATGFCAQLKRPSLVIVVGDHQPPIEQLNRADPSRDVPMHLIANRPALLEPFRSTGFVDGLDIPDDVVAFQAATFLPRLLRAFGSAAPS